MRDRSTPSRSTFQGLPRAAVRDLGCVPDHVAVTVFWALCIQVMIVSTWKLLTLVKNDRIFTDASLVWVNAIVWAIAAAWVVLVGVLLYVGFNANDPGLPLLLFLMSVGVTVLGLLMLVMRTLLQQATTLRTDMEAVI